MQSLRLYYSRLGIACSRKSANYSSYINGGACRYQSRALESSPCSPDEQNTAPYSYNLPDEKRIEEKCPHGWTSLQQAGKSEQRQGIGKYRCITTEALSQNKPFDADVVPKSGIEDMALEIPGTVHKKKPREVSAKVRKKTRISPTIILARWLDMDDISERDQYWLNIRKFASPSSLPFILLNYLHRSENPNYFLHDSEQSFLEAATTKLRIRGLTMDDVSKWAWIVSAQDTENMVERFISTSCEKPSFLLLEVLRRDVLHVRTLKLLLIYAWDQILGKFRPNLNSLSEVEIDAVIPWSEMTQFSLSNINSPYQPSRMEETAFISLLSRLLYQTRRLWPPAVVSISHMVAPFVHSILDSSSSEPKKLDSRTHHRICRLHNRMLRLVALPASISPLKSMVYNWQAQRVLLEMTAQFEPPLTLDQNSYRAVIQVLVASKKSDRESRVASLRTRSWPPWRIEQDGMDAQRSLEDDLSRVIAATIRMKESGYSENAQDKAIGILGGQEPDGTPTIHTRRLLKRRSRRPARPLQNDPEAQIWAARIQSTRDTQEAWSAFIGFQEQGHHPSLPMYFAMFEKLHSESARSARIYQLATPPGDGKEVLPPSNDNFSKFYQLRLQSPTVDDLYKQMIQADLRPSGRFLTFLVQHARTPDEGLQVLRDSRMDPRAVEFLCGSKDVSPAILQKVADSTFAAFITLLCRFAPRAIASGTDSTVSDEIPGADGVDAPTKTNIIVANEWTFLELRKDPRRPRLDPLLHCAELLKQSQTRFRPAWYALFSALARRGVIIHRSLVGDPKNDILAWRILVAALDDFHRCGLELDPRGFHIICNGLEKAILASFNVPENQRADILDNSQLTLVVNEFMKLSEVMETQHRSIPQLLHSVEGAHLHAFVRVLGLSEDYGGMIYVLEWMVKHHEALEEIAIQSRNGPKLIRRVIVAMKVFLRGTEHEAEAERLVASVEKWEGWPQDFEVEKYINRWSGRAEHDGSVPSC